MNQKIKDSLNLNNQGTQLSLNVLQQLQKLFKGQTGGIADLLNSSIQQLQGIPATNATQTQTGNITDQLNLGAAQGAAGQLGNANSSFDQLLGSLFGGGGTTPEQQALIESAANNALQSGTADINRQRDQGLQALRTELAPARGLRPNDTPIVDRGGQIVGEANKAADALSAQIRGQQAQFQLQYPLQVQQNQISGLGLQSQYAQQQQQFLSQLQQQALQNRLGLANALGSTGLNIAGIGQQTAATAKGSPITGVQQGPTTLQQILQGLQVGGGIAGGLGGLATGIAAL